MPVVMLSRLSLLFWLAMLPAFRLPAQHAAVDSLIRHVQSTYNIPGLAVGIVRDGKPWFSYGYGVTSIETGGPVTDSTVFHTASISKLFTAEAIMRLVGEQKLSLNAKLPEIIPKLRHSDKRVGQITVRQLLTHTSGLPDVRNYHWESANRAPDALEKYVLGRRLACRFDPGSDYYYSNLGYDILGLVVQRVSGQPFEEFVARNILAPSGMLHSDFRYYQIPDHLRTSPHSRKRKSRTIYVRKHYPYNRAHSPSSTLNASAKDLNKWMIRLMSDINRPDSHFRQMIQPGSVGNERMGLGFQLSTLGPYRTAGHYGGDKGFRSYLLMIPEQNLGLVLVANCDYNEDFRQEILHGIAWIMLSAD